MAGVSGWGRIRGNTMVLLQQVRDKIVQWTRGANKRSWITRCSYRDR